MGVNHRITVLLVPWHLDTLSELSALKSLEDWDWS